MYCVSEDFTYFAEHNAMVATFKDPIVRVQARQMFPNGEWRDKSVLLPLNDGNILGLMQLGVESAMQASPFWLENHPLVEGKYEPMPHQVVTAGFIVTHPRCYVLSDCRLGKTGSLIMAMDYAMRKRLFQGGVLVITTLTTITSVWEACIHSTLPRDDILIVHGANKEKALLGSAPWFLTNYDSVRLNLDLFKSAVKNKRIGAVVIDEATHVGNASSLRHKAISKLVNDPPMEFVVGMTGTPGAKPEPVFGMAKTINPNKLPVSTKTGWMDLTTYRTGPQPYMYRMRSTAPEIIRQTLSPSIRFRKEDVLDLPPVVYQLRTCVLTDEQNRMIEELRDEAVAIASSGEVVTAPTAAVVLNKLLQVPLGFAIADGKTVDLAHDNRTLTIKEVIDETDRKVVIFCMFKRRLEQLEKEIKGAARIDGSIRGDLRAQILHDFQYTDSPRVLVCHPTTVGFGTELSAADTLIFDGPPMLGSFAYSQALERLSSTKQKADKISVIQIAGSQEEIDFFKKLDSGQTQMQAIAELFERFRHVHQRIDN